MSHGQRASFISSTRASGQSPMTNASREPIVEFEGHEAHARP
jgi:hypothetical protein